MNVLPDVASEALDYNNIKRRAMASRSYRVRIAPSNKVNFSAGETIYMDLPSNLSGTFMDMTQTYIRLKVKYTLGTNAIAYLDKAGAYSLINRVQCITSGQQVFDLANYNVLVSALMDTDASPDWKANQGRVLCGTTGANPFGERIAGSGITVTRTYCLPFILNPFALQKKLVPLFSLDSLRFRIQLETNSLAIAQTTSTCTYEITEAELVTYFTELSPSSMAQLDSLTGGVYNLLCPSYMNTTATDSSTGSHTLNTTLGIAVSSLERIIVIHRLTAAVNNASALSLGARTSSDIQTAQFFINSEAFPQRNIQNEDMGAEVLAEYLISDHALSDFSKQCGITQFNASVGVSSGINNFDSMWNRAFASTNSVAQNYNPFSMITSDGLILAATTDPLAIGSFILSLELESGVSAGRSDRLYSGISTISSVVQYKGTYGSSCVACNIDFFAQFTVLLTLNMRQTGVWSITI